MRWKFLGMLGVLLVFGWLKGIKVICFTFYRSPQDQKAEFEAGRSRVIFGKHQGWLAVDLCIVDDEDDDLIVDRNELRWSTDPRYTELGLLWELMGGTWGGRWKDPRDIYHFEL